VSQQGVRLNAVGLESSANGSEEHTGGWCAVRAGSTGTKLARTAASLWAGFRVRV